VAFGSAYGGGGGPTHQLAELGLCPTFTQAKGPDVCAYDGELLGRDLIDAATPSGRHVLDCLMTLQGVKASGRPAYRFAASIAKAL
jgi:hypothetical protein